MIFKNSNFSEQSAWISVIFAIFIAAFYGYGMMQLEGNFSTHAGQVVWLWIETTIVSIVFMIIAFALLSVIKSKSKSDEDDDIGLIDERDEVIEAKATFWAYFNLHFCLTVLLIHIFCQSTIVGYPFFANVPPIDFLIHGLMFSGLLVEFILRATQIYRYRKAV